jgi:hypothetical protein
MRTDLETEAREPRSFTGWGATYGFLARGHNDAGEYRQAKEVCERALEHVTPEDHEFGILFAGPELELAIAEAGLGQFPAAMTRVDRVLERHAGVDQPLLQGVIHETRARIAWGAGNTAEYRKSLLEVERWFRPTETPILIARCERLAELDAAGTGKRRAFRPGGNENTTDSKSGPSTGAASGGGVAAGGEAQTVQANPKRVLTPS